MTPTRLLKLLAALALLVTLAAACSSRPDGVIGPDRMAALLADVHEAEGVVETERTTYGSDSMRRVLRLAVYGRHGVTAAEVDSSMMWYGRHIEQYIEVYEKVIDILDERLLAANTLSARAGDTDRRAISIEGDSVDLWTAPRQRRFYARGDNQYVSCRITSDSHWEPNDRFTLQFKAINPRRPLAYMLMAEYDDGSVEIAARQTPQPGWADVSLTVEGMDINAGITGRRPRAIAALIDYAADADEQMYIDSISLVRVHPRLTRATAVGSAEPSAPSAPSESDTVPRSR